MDFLLKQSSNQPLKNLGNGSTPLVSACRSGNIRIADLLLRHSPQLVFVSEEQNMLSPFHISCSRGEVGMVRCLLNTAETIFNDDATMDADLNLQDCLGRTPLFNACYHGRVEVVRELLSFRKNYPDKIDVNLAEKAKRTPLHAAIASKKALEITKLLLNEQDLDINTEAFPSSRTQKTLSAILERKKSATFLPIVESLTQADLSEIEEDQVQSPTSSLSDMSLSDNIDSEIGIIAPDTPNKGRVTSMYMPASPMTYRPRPLSPSLSHSSLGYCEVYQTSDKILNVYYDKPDNADHMTKFSNMLLSPLAEACVFRSLDMVKLLVQYGARDSTGLACQLAYLVHKPALINLVIAHECEEQEQLVDATISEQMPKKYILNWKEKNLRALEGAWLSHQAVYHSSDVGSNSREFSCQPVPTIAVNFESISCVQLGNNNLRHVPIELFQLPYVNTIDLRGNLLSSLPEEPTELSGWKCNVLTHLLLTRNKLTTIPSAVWYLQSLHSLYVDWNELTDIKSDHVANTLMCSSTVEINLAHNKLYGLHEFFFAIPTLRKINLSHNAIISLPNNLWDCETLEELDVSHNNLEFLPRCEFDESTVARGSTSTDQEDVHIMEWASLGFGGVDSAPVSLNDREKSFKKRASSRTTPFKITRLKDTHSGDMSTQIQETCDYSMLTKLNVSGNNFYHFPTGLPCLAPNLVDLDISDNPVHIVDIHFIPQSIRKLTANNCQIERFGNTLMKYQIDHIQRNCCRPEETVCFHRQHNQPTAAPHPLSQRQPTEEVPADQIPATDAQDAGSYRERADVPAALYVTGPLVPLP